MFATTPSSIGKSVFLLRDKLGLNTDPVFVDVRDTEGHKFNDCYFNVKRKIAKDGGSILYGWTVWEAPKKMIEAEFHAVWVSDGGELVDITPHADGERRIVFIPDHTRVYTKEPVDNVRLSLCNDPMVLALIEQNEKMTELRRKYNDGTGESQIPIYEVEEMMGVSFPKVVPPTIKTLSTMKIRRNDPCQCGSGKKYKKCCGSAL